MPSTHHLESPMPLCPSLCSPTSFLPLPTHTYTLVSRELGEGAELAAEIAEHSPLVERSIWGSRGLHLKHLSRPISEVTRPPQSSKIVTQDL